MTAAEKTSANTVVFLHSGYSVDIEIAKYVAAGFAELGYSFESFSLADPAMAAQTLGLYMSAHLNEIFCFVSLNYYGEKVRAAGKLLHQATGIPLVFFLMDHPIYFMAVQEPAFEGAIVFAPGADLIDFVSRYFPKNTIAVLNRAFTPPPFPEREPDFADFSARRNEILCPMNLSIWGGTMDGVWGLIKELPAVRQSLVVRTIEAALVDCFTPIHVMAERVAGDGGLPDGAIDDVRLALDFVKIWRRDHMVRTLIDLPILWSSQYVPADLQIRYPKKFTLLSMADTLPLYARFRFVLNSIPMMIDNTHERVNNALWANAVLITDENRAIREIFTDRVNALFYDYSSGDMAQKIARYLDDPVAAYELTVNAYDLRKKQQAFAGRTYRDLVETVKRLRLNRQTQPTA